MSPGLEVTLPAGYRTASPAAPSRTLIARVLERRKMSGLTLAGFLRGRSMNVYAGGSVLITGQGRFTAGSVVEVLPIPDVIALAAAVRRRQHAQCPGAEGNRE